MKKFIFPLQSLLELREKQLEEKQIEFGKLQFILRALKNELDNLFLELHNAKENLENLIETGNNIDVFLINSGRYYIAQKKHDILDQENKIEAHNLKVQEKQREMLEALKARTMLEKLKEKQYKIFLKKIDNAEKKELDEIGLMRYAR